MTSYGMKRYAIVAWNNPLLGSGFSGIIFSGLDVCRMDDSHLLKQLLWVERPVGWRCPPSAPRKQWKDQVAADVMTHLPRCLYHDPLMAAAGMTTERGAWRGLRYDITGINRHRDQSSERTDPDDTSIVE